jgi:serine/threonine-protein kinase
MLELNRRAQARVGTWLRDKWKLDQLVGVGGMAAVYSATHRNGNRVAIKLLHLELSLDADARDRFRREGYVANKVGHVGAVAVLDDAEAEDGSIFLVMELLEGLSLADLSEQTVDCRLELRQTLSISDQLLDVLTAAHRAGIVHRDIKPENVFITHEGRVKLLDFGIAKLREGESSFKTRTGNAMGTPAFMAPEQAAGRWSEVGPHSHDVHAAHQGDRA